MCRPAERHKVPCAPIIGIPEMCLCGCTYDLACIPEEDTPTKREGGLGSTPSSECDHGVKFDYEASKGLTADKVRLLWPRLFGKCPLGCGFKGIGYASFEHYIAGDW